MYPKAKITIVFCLIVLMFCIEAVSDSTVAVPVTSASKFLDRIVKKQELLICKAQDKDEICRMIKPGSGAADAEMAEELSMSDMKYIARCERKLGLLINETLDKAGVEMEQYPFRPVSMNNLLPESRFDSIDMEKEMEEVEENEPAAEDK